MISLIVLLRGGATPLVFVTGFNYEIQKWSENRLLKAVASGWTIGGLLRYTSGTTIGIPGSANGIGNQLFRVGTVQNRVPGEPLYLKDIGCGCVDPTRTGTQPESLGGCSAGPMGILCGGVQRLPLAENRGRADEHWPGFPH